MYSLSRICLGDDLHVHHHNPWQASQPFNRRLGSSRILVVVERICGTLHPARPKSEKRSRWPSAQPAHSLQQHINRIAQNLPGVSIPSKEADLQGERPMKDYLVSRVPFWPAPQRQDAQSHRISRARRAAVEENMPAPRWK